MEFKKILGKNCYFEIGEYKFNTYYLLSTVVSNSSICITLPKNAKVKKSKNALIMYTVKNGKICQLSRDELLKNVFDITYNSDNKIYIDKFFEMLKIYILNNPRKYVKFKLVKNYPDPLVTILAGLGIGIEKAKELFYEGEVPYSNLHLIDKDLNNTNFLKNLNIQKFYTKCVVSGKEENLMCLTYLTNFYELTTNYLRVIRDNNALLYFNDSVSLFEAYSSCSYSRILQNNLYLINNQIKDEAFPKKEKDKICNFINYLINSSKDANFSKEVKVYNKLLEDFIGNKNITKENKYKNLFVKIMNQLKVIDNILYDKFNEVYTKGMYLLVDDIIKSAATLGRKLPDDITKFENLYSNERNQMVKKINTSLDTYISNYATDFEDRLSVFIHPENYLRSLFKNEYKELTAKQDVKQILKDTYDDFIKNYMLQILFKASGNNDKLRLNDLSKDEKYEILKNYVINKINILKEKEKNNMKNVKDVEV